MPPDQNKLIVATSSSLQEVVRSEPYATRELLNVDAFLFTLEKAFIPFILDVQTERKAGEAVRSMSKVIIDDLLKFSSKEQEELRIKMWEKSAEAVAHVMVAKGIVVSKDFEAAVMHPDLQKYIKHYTEPGEKRDSVIDTVAGIAKVMNDIIHTPDEKANFTKKG